MTTKNELLDLIGLSINKANELEDGSTKPQIITSLMTADDFTDLYEVEESTGSSASSASSASSGSSSTSSSGSSESSGSSSVSIFSSYSSSGSVTLPQPGPGGPDDDFIRTRMDTIPNYGQHPTHTSVQSGMWSNPDTWDNGVPGHGSIVRAAHVISLDGDQMCEVVGVTGLLSFQDASSLVVMAIINYREGEIQAGIESAPITATVTFNDAAIDTTFDPEQWGMGLLNFGKLTIRGRTKMRTIHAVVEPKAGDNRIMLAEIPAGWEVGDEIVIADTRQLTSDDIDQSQRAADDAPLGNHPRWKGSIAEPQMERRFITGITGASIDLDVSLTYDHLGARDDDGTLTVCADGVRLLPHVGNLTNSIVLQSENPNGTRAHTANFGRANVDVGYGSFIGMGRTHVRSGIHNTTFEHHIRFNEDVPLAEIVAGDVVIMESAAGVVLDPDRRGEGRLPKWHAAMDHGAVTVRHNNGKGHSLGPVISTTELERTIAVIGTNQIARYPFHTHHLAGPRNPDNTGYQFRVEGCVVDSGPKWGYTVHSSHYGLIKDNIAVNCDGAGFAFEDGSETGNELVGNFAVGCMGTGLLSRESLDPHYFGDWQGHEGAGFWLGSDNSIVKDNIGAGNRMAGINLTIAAGIPKLSPFNRPAKFPLFRGADMHEDSGEWTHKINDNRHFHFENNMAYGSGRDGIELWFKNGRQTLRRIKVWHSRLTGISYNYQTQLYTEEDTIIRGAEIGISVARLVDLKRIDVQGCPIGLTCNGREMFEISDSIILASSIGIKIGSKRWRFRDSVQITNTLIDSPVLFELEPNFWSSQGRNQFSKRQILYADQQDDHWIIFADEQHPDQIIGESGLTNQQSSDAGGPVYGGEIAICTDSTGIIGGFICPAP